MSDPFASGPRGPLMMLAGSANRPLAEEIAETLGMPLGQTTVRRFADGEIFVRIDENVRGRDTFIIQPTPAPADSVMELLLLLDAAKRWSDHFGRPIHLGEFGAIDAASPESRIRYVKDVKSAAEARGIPWTLWDWKAKFAYWDKKTNQPLLRTAIFE